ncbi:MAG: MBL fold metallo-hydrolase [Candidatus Hodarchaeota archaeon]
MISVYPLQGISGLSSSILVNWEGTRFLLDAGPGAVTEIWRRGIRLRGLSAIFISHAHLDHLWGLPPLLWFLHQHEWSHELALYFPHEAESVVKQMVELSGAPPFVIFNPCSLDGVPFHFNSLTVQAFGVSHPGPSYGFTIAEQPKVRLDTVKLKQDGIPVTQWAAIAKGKRIKYKSGNIDPKEYQLKPRCRKIVFTGDAGPATQLLKQAQGADLLIIEATWLHPQWGLEDDAPHLTLRQAFEIGQRGEVARMLLFHLTSRVSFDDYRQAITVLQEEFNSEIPVFLPTDEKIEIP